MTKIDLLDLPPGSQVRITDIEGHHTTIITTTRTERENDECVSDIHVVTDEPGFNTSTGILPTGRMAGRYIEVDHEYFVEDFGGGDGTCDMVVWSVSVVT